MDFIPFSICGFPGCVCVCAFLISTSVSTSPLNLWEDSPGELANWPRRRAQVCVWGGGGLPRTLSSSLYSKT